MQIRLGSVSWAAGSAARWTNVIGAKSGAPQAPSSAASAAAPAVLRPRADGATFSRSERHLVDGLAVVIAQTEDGRFVAVDETSGMLHEAGTSEEAVRAAVRSRRRHAGETKPEHPVERRSNEER